MTFRCGEILEDRYKINDLLGQGGFGAVYKALDLRLNILCAIKESFDVSEVATRQFRREASMLAELRHPNLPRVTDYFDLRAKGLYLVMDFIEGEDLGTKLIKKGGRFSQEQVAPWLRQICEALDYLHSRNPPIIHRDIKLQNIIVTKDNAAILVDFGLAKFYDPSRPTTMGAQGGTPGFSPIEQYGQGATDQRSDIYSLGATIYTLLTGQVPPESIQRVIHDSLEPIRMINPEVSTPVEKAVLKALRIDPASRIQTVKDFMGTLSGFAESIKGVNDNSSVISSTSSISHEIPRISPYSWMEEPDQVSEWIDKGSDYKLDKRYIEALGCYDKVLEINPQNLEALDGKGDTFNAMGRYEEAIRCAEKILEIDPLIASAWWFKGMNFRQLGRHEEAIKYYDKALEIKPKKSGLWIDKGWSLKELGHPEEALRCYDKAMEIDPQDSAAWRFKGILLSQLDRREEALCCFDKVLEINPQFAYAWKDKGECLEDLGRHEEAIRCFDKVLELDPQDSWAWNNKGRSLSSLGCHEEAIHCLDKALEIDQQDRLAWENKGRILGILGRHEEANRCQMIAAAIDAGGEIVDIQE